ncbi:unnamed protein product [Cylicocyclus nassatus]|uniref:Major facilitator superfamily (MFS) profile domain-containing protein n=1 Tax=Cylicocyclus nassatus TaxID=53992 RepID=A0AA36HBJ2_CYLNA|nr:unnamed protein product [Cylicocyclus nassatus]
MASANQNKIAPEQSSLDSVRFAEKPKQVTFEQFMVEHLGSLGRYQLIQFLLVCIPSAFVSLHVMSWTFVSIPSCSGGENCTINGYSAADRWNLQGDRAWIKATVQSLYYIGHMVGATLWGIVSDKFGRKKAYCIAITAQISCGLVLIIAPTWWLFGIFKLGTGVAHPGLYAVSIVLATELLGATWRRLSAIGAGILGAVGELILAGLAYLIRDYRALHAAFVLPSLLFISYWWLVPESLRWLVLQGRFDEADRVMSKAARINKANIPDKWWEKLEISANTKQTAGFLDLFRTQKLRRRILVAILVWPVNSMVYYGLTMKSDVGGGSLYVNFAISAAMELPGLIVLYLLMDRIGRRRLISCSLAIAGICLVLNWAIGDNVPVYWGMVQIAIAKGAITVSYTGVYAYTSEMFPTVIRNTAVGCCSTASRIGAIAASYVALWLVDEYGKLAMVIPFSLLALISAALTALLLPETMNKPLPETIDDVEGKNQ